MAASITKILGESNVRKSSGSKQMERQSVLKKERKRERERKEKKCRKMIKRKRMLDSRKKGKACVCRRIWNVVWLRGKTRRAERFAARYAPFPVRFFADGGSSTILFRGRMAQGQRIANSMLAFPRWIVIYARCIPPRKKQSSSRGAISRPLAPRSQSIRFARGFVSTGFVSNIRGCRFMRPRRATIEGEFFAEWTAVVPCV